MNANETTPQALQQRQNDIEVSMTISQRTTFNNEQIAYRILIYKKP